VYQALTRTWCRAAAVVLLALGATAALAQVQAPATTTEAVSVAQLFKTQQIANATLSPNGKFLATTANIGGRMQLAVVDLETMTPKNIAGFTEIDIVGVRWLSNERLVYSVVNRGGDQRNSAQGLFAVNRDGSNDRVLMAAPELIAGFVDQGTWLSEARGMQMLSVVRDKPDDILAIGYYPNRDAVPYRVNTLTGRRSEIDYKLNGIARGFVFDAQDRLRVVVTANREVSVLSVWYRDSESAPWRKLSEHSAFEPRFTVLAFDADGKTMLVSATTPGSSRLGVYKFDFEKNVPGELLASDSAVDVNELVFAPDTRQVVGINIPSEPPKKLWLDKGLAALQAGLDKAIAGRVNVLQITNANAPRLIYSYSSTHPGQYALYHPEQKKLQNLFATRPWIDAGKLSPQMVYDYQARDGLPIMAYVTLPKGREPKALPLIALIHGGPWARDDWGFNAEVQMLAGMGYAVLQPQFRGSSGFGREHLKKSFGQWGLSMQDDITDGVQSLIKQGVVDAKRVCIMGASYGGYATMMGLVKDPGLYRCGVNLLGVTDMFYHASSGRSHDPEVNYFLDSWVGDPVKLKDQFTATSPALQAQRITAPVYMVYGKKDRRVPVVHGREMRDALQKHGKAHEYVELEYEEHGFSSEAVQVDVYKGVQAFLRKHIPAQ
jgi:dipeptidyl aminopeptidase/acylaminoacyl peptidase